MQQPVLVASSVGAAAVPATDPFISSLLTHSNYRLFPLPVVQSPHCTSSHSPRCRTRFRFSLLYVLVANQLIVALNLLAVSFYTAEARSVSSPLFNSTRSASTSAPTHPSPSSISNPHSWDPASTASDVVSLVCRRLFGIARDFVKSSLSSRRADPQSALSVNDSASFLNIPPPVLRDLLAGQLVRSVHHRTDTRRDRVPATARAVPSSRDAVTSRSFQSVTPPPAALPGDADVDRWLDVLSADQPSSSLPLSFFRSYSKAVSVPLNAARVSLPSEAGAVSLLDNLPPNYSKRYSDPSHSLLPVGTVDVAALSHAYGPPRAHGCSRDDYVALIQRMHRLGMLGLTTRPAVVNGLFAVPKDEHSQRVIIDARYANAFFVRPEKVALPTPDLISELVVGATDTLYVAKCDLSDFYHSLLMPEWMWPFFCLPAVSYREIGIDRDGTAHPMCRTLPMGFSHAVLLAQLVHEHVIAESGLFTLAVPISRLSSPHVSAEVDRLLMYIDDVVLIGTDRERLATRQTDYADAIVARGFKLKRAKLVLPTADAVDCIGVSIDGRRRTVGLSRAELRILVSTTLSLVTSPLVSGEELARLVGGWSWAFLCCRSAFSVFSAVYRFVSSVGRRRVRPWRSVVSELALAVDLAPLLWSSLALPMLGDVIATDASSEGQGVVTVQLPPVCVRLLSASTISPALLALDASRAPGMIEAVAQSIDPDLLSYAAAGLIPDCDRLPLPALPGPFSLYRPSASRFLPCTATGSVRERQIVDSESLCVPNAVGLLMNDRFADLYDSISGLRWTTVVSSRWRECLPDHINSKELRATETGIRSVLFNRSVLDCRLLVFTDSTVALFGLSKGRSSSPDLLRRTRSVAAILLATGIRPYYRYITSARNPADHPSRNFAPRR